MSLLTSRLPTYIEIDGMRFDMNTNFRNSIMFESLILNEDISKEEVQEKAIKLYYEQPITDRFKNAALQGIMWFYSCGRSEEETEGKKEQHGNTKSSDIYSFKYDDEYIYSAFLDQYRVDLQDIDYLHWWKFKAMFKSLKSDNKIVEIMGYRNMDLSSIKDKSQKDFYKKMQDLYRLPTIINKGELEKQKAIEDALLNGGDLNGIL
ncbi:bacteriophage Gp15 family protein [Clostridium sp. ZBS4]|uniref:bacteriophage Gp15 family protein n=1 Tax=Clostridium sp. ZBS4 TaxID=2949974 RepID=UPI0020793BBE|nr:bacteriophage Gp15 family protein [Clostridium sp. ZBS4]